MQQGKQPMTRVLKIARMGHPILSQRSHEVLDPTSGETQEIINQMLVTADDIGEYAGLAAPQVFIPQRIVIFQIPAKNSRGTSAEDIPLTIMINPEIEITDDEPILDWEACFSVPGLMGLVPRHKGIRYHYTTPEGERITREATLHHARVIQHECDHLDGVLYPQRMRDLTKLAFLEEGIRYLREK